MLLDLAGMSLQPPDYQSDAHLTEASVLGQTGYSKSEDPDQMPQNVLMPNLDGDRQTGVHYMPFPPFFEWRGHKKYGMK